MSLDGILRLMMNMQSTCDFERTPIQYFLRFYAQIIVTFFIQQFIIEDKKKVGLSQIRSVQRKGNKT
jgi:hypothetical protein